MCDAFLVGRCPVCGQIGMIIFNCFISIIAYERDSGVDGDNRWIETNMNELLCEYLCVEYGWDTMKR